MPLVAPMNVSLKRVGRLAVMLVLAGVVGACATNPGEGGVPNPDDKAAFTRDESLIAIDLVSTMMQLPQLSPFHTTLQFSPPRTGFGAALLDAVKNSGFGVQRVEQDQGQRYVAYGRRLVESVGSEHVVYFMRVAGTVVERHYTRQDDVLVPSSPVRIIGSEPTPVVMNDDLHRQRLDARTTFPSGVVFIDKHGNTLEQREHQVEVGDNPAGRALGRGVTAQRYVVLARAALFQNDRIHRSADALEGTREPRWQITVTFDSSTSLHLGEANKRALRRLRGRMRLDSDRLTVSGCSHGKSLLWDGTESDALARSQRIKEELLLDGVPHGSIHEEGCFDSLYGESLVPNSVNVTLERLAGVEQQADRSINRSNDA